MSRAAGGKSGPAWKRVFLGPLGLRAGWRLLIFLALSMGMGILAGWALQKIPHDPTAGWAPRTFIVIEGVSFLTAWLAIAIMGRFERRSLAAYGLPLRGVLGRFFWKGSLWGLVAVVGLVALIGLAGGLRIDGLVQTGSALFVSSQLWLIAMLFLGLFEELYFRGYPLFTLSTGMGFWPASVLLSATFGALHYFTKPMENWVDALSVALIGLFLCLTLRRTGSLWFAVGFHFSFDYAALILFGAPNTGNNGRSIADRILNVSYIGPDWLTGGPRGIEASALVFIVIALLFATFHFRYRDVRYPLVEPETSRPRS